MNHRRRPRLVTKPNSQLRTGAMIQMNHWKPIGSCAVDGATIAPRYETTFVAHSRRGGAYVSGLSAPLAAAALGGGRGFRLRLLERLLLRGALELGLVGLALAAGFVVAVFEAFSIRGHDTWPLFRDGGDRGVSRYPPARALLAPGPRRSRLGRPVTRELQRG